MKTTERQRRIEAKRLLKKPESQWERVDLSTAQFVPKGMTAAFRNNRYTVMIYHNIPTTKGAATRVLIQNHTNTPFVKHWSEMQRIKNEIFGNEIVAIEYFPKESELVDQFNIYWFWIFPEGVIPIPL